MGWIERLPPFLLFKMGGLRGAALTYPRFFEKTRRNFKKKIRGICVNPCTMFLVMVYLFNVIPKGTSAQCLHRYAKQLYR